MQDYIIYILIGICALLFIAVLVLIGRSAGLKRDLEETRRDVAESRNDTLTYLQQGLSALNNTLNSNAMQTDQRMENLRTSVDKRLENIQYTVDEKLQRSLDERLSRSFASVRESLDEVYKGLGEMQTLASGVGDLKKVLTNVKSRGILGEIQLGSILEQILSKDQYLENTVTVPGSKERVEYAVKMPGNGAGTVLLPIDAKFPGDTYAHLMDAYESADSSAIDACRKALANVIRKEAKDIRDKYVKSPYTTDFGVMFLPFEGLYAEVVNMGLLEILQREYKVMIAGPSTMSALLNSLQMGFKTLAIQQNAGRVWKVLSGVKSEFDSFEAVLTDTQNKLDLANKELDKLIGVRTRAIQRTLSEMQTLGEADRLPGTDRDI